MTSVSIGDRGQIDLERLKDMDGSVVKEAIEESAKIRKHMSEAGVLRLPKLLEKKRLEFGIVDDCFRIQATLNRVFVWQIETEEFAGGKAGGEEGVIVVPEMAQERMKFEAPRGIIVSMGLDAMRSLRGNGVTLGHTILMTQPSPLSIEVGRFFPQQRLYILMDRDINGSEDLEQARRAGRVVASHRTMFKPDGTASDDYCLLDPREGGDVSWDPEDVPFADEEVSNA